MHPIFIAGAAVLGLPILLHLLLRQQPKRMVFPALRFLNLRQKTNQRRVQLKHILLLILRCLLLAFFALALFQPTLSSGGVLNPFGGEPVAAVIVVDTSPSMGYREGNASRLDEARRRAADLLNELPPNSRVAVLPSHDPSGMWQPTLLEARQRLDALKEPTGSAESLLPAIRAAYDLLATADADKPEAAELMPRLLAIFTDGTSGCWSEKELSSLQSKRDSLVPSVAHAFVTVGQPPPKKDEPPPSLVPNLAVIDLKMDTDRLSGVSDAVVTAMIRSQGIAVEGLTITAQLDDGPSEQASIDLPIGSSLPAVFTFRKPTPGFHTVTVRLGRDDALAFDNERTLTFEVLSKRSILAIADRVESVRFWRDSHNVGSQEFECSVVTPDAVPPLAPFEMVAVIGVADPRPFSQKLVEYVNGGGKLLVAPDGPGSETDTKRAAAYNMLGELLPAPLLDEVKTFANPTKKVFGLPWRLNDEADLRPAMFAPIRDWQRQGDIDVFKSPKITAKYRPVGDSTAKTVAKYADEDGTKAVVERNFGSGHVLLLTTRIDDDASEPENFWNDYWTRDHSWPVVFPWLVTRYLCDLGSEAFAGGSGDKRRFNFATGAEVNASVRGFTPGGDRRLRLEGPGVAAGKSKLTLPVDVTTLTMRNKPQADAPRGNVRAGVWELDGEPLLTPGAFSLLPDGVESPWRFRFSLAVPAFESDLQPVPEESLAQLVGQDRVFAADKSVSLNEVITRRLNSTVELFPTLIILVLIFFAVEGFLANRFYKLK